MGMWQVPGFYDAVKSPDPEQLAAIAEQGDNEEQLRQIYQVTRFLNDLQWNCLREQAAFTPTCNLAGLNAATQVKASKLCYRLGQWQDRFRLY